MIANNPTAHIALSAKSTAKQVRQFYATRNIPALLCCTVRTVLYERSMALAGARIVPYSTRISSGCRTSMYSTSQSPPCTIAYPTSCRIRSFALDPSRPPEHRMLWYVGYGTASPRDWQSRGSSDTTMTPLKG